MTATAGHGAATVSWSAPPGGGGDELHRHAVHRVDRADADDRHRRAAGDEHDDHRPHRRARPTRSRSRPSNANGTGPVSAPSNSVTPTGAIAPSAPDRRGARARPPARPRSAGPRPTTTASPITGYTVTPFIGTTAQTPVQVNNGSATSATITGLTNGTAYTFTVTATNGVGTSPASTAVQRGDPRRHDLRLHARRRSSTRATRRSLEVGVKFTARRPARSPASGSTRRRPTPARTSAACGPRRARCWPRPPSPTRPPPAGST